MAGAPPPYDPCDDPGFFQSNQAICMNPQIMNPQIVGEAQPAN